MNKVFIVGAPRSGTTWLQLLLSQHPHIATCQETHFFSGYMRPLFKQWKKEQIDGGGRNVGLSSIIAREEFIELCRASSDYLFKLIADRKPGSTWVLEKTPVHVRYTHIIRELYPEARFIHLVRDPRSVVASLKAASAAWGNSWQNADLYELTQLWKESVSRGEILVSNSSLTSELRYEDLRINPLENLQKLFQWLDLPAESSLCENAIANTAFEKLSRPDEGRDSAALPWPMSDEPGSFFRKGSMDSWREELAPYEVFSIEKATKQLMNAYGYETVSNFPLHVVAAAFLATMRHKLSSRKN